MGAEENPSRPLTFQEIPELRRKTQTISKFLQEQLLAHLDTLRPVLSPARVFGQHAGPAGTKADTSLADRALAQLRLSYKPFATRPFDLPSEFDPYWLTLVGNRIALYPWEYTYETKTERETKLIGMTSPVRWVMSFTSAYTLSQVRQAIVGKGETRPEHIRQFVVNALVTQLIVTHTPGLASLFTDLRYHIQPDFAPDLPGLALTTITSGLPSFRPVDELILSATNFSGVPAFIELIDIDTLPHLQDPLKARIEELLH